jgi:polyhydroxyalkanoic acid synthase PhaR subunit
LSFLSKLTIILHESREYIFHHHFSAKFTKRRGEEFGEEMKKMNQQLSFDPFKIWKEFYDKSESSFGKMFDEAMHKEDFSEWMGHFLNLYIQYQNMVKQSTEKYLEAANFPSRADISNLASLIVNLESKVDDLEDIVETGLKGKSETTDVAKEINELKSNMSNIEGKLEKLLELVKKQGEQFSLVSNETASAQEKDKEKKGKK